MCEAANDNQPSMTVIFLVQMAPRVSGAAPQASLLLESLSDPDDGDCACQCVPGGWRGATALSTQDSVIYLVCVGRRLDREERDAYNLRELPPRTQAHLHCGPRLPLCYMSLMSTTMRLPLTASSYRPEPLPEVALPGSFVVRGDGPGS